jgi:hypothetical protein
MYAMRVSFFTGILLLASLSASAQTTLYVNAASGNDNVLKSQNSASTPWRSIGRAVWGSTNRSAPNANEAAAAGDTVLVAGGTYTTNEVVNNRWGVVYNPVNNGAAGRYITIQCVGTCVLGAQYANGPVIGAEGRDYVKWYADIFQGHAWQITAYGPQGGSASPTQVNTAPDTGPVVCHASTGCWVEGAVVNGGVRTDYDDNYNGFRIEQAPGTVLRNNSVRSFHNLSNGVNGTGFTLYGSPNSIVEHNYVTDVATAFIFKDQSFTYTQSGVRVRFNKFEGVDRCVEWSMTAEDRNYVYQNVCANSGFGIFTTGGGLSNDWIFNNTFYNVPNAAVYPTTLGSGGRFWNNIVLNTGRVILLENGTMPAETVFDFEHNVYWGYTGFYTGLDGNKTFANYRAAFPTQDGASPGSVDGNPLLVNPDGGDFRICTGAGSPAASCTGASPAINRGVDIGDLDGDGNTTETIRAGAYVTNTEIIGLENSPAPSGGGAAAPAAPSNLRILSSQ